MGLSRQEYNEIRGRMRNEIVRLQRARAMVWEINAAQRRLSRLDMAWARGEDWHISYWEKSAGS